MEGRSVTSSSKPWPRNSEICKFAQLLKKQHGKPQGRVWTPEPYGRLPNGRALGGACRKTIILPAQLGGGGRQRSFPDSFDLIIFETDTSSATPESKNKAVPCGSVQNPPKEKKSRSGVFLNNRGLGPGWAGKWCWLENGAHWTPGKGVQPAGSGTQVVAWIR